MQNWVLYVQKFTPGADVDKQPANDHTGTPLDAGNLLTVFFSNVGTISNEAPDRVTLQYHFSSILELANGGATYYT